MQMKFSFRHLPLIMLGAFTINAVAACARPVEVYDPRYNDSHRWDRAEDAAYRRWEAEKRVEHLEYSSRRAEEQREYWVWRHEHRD